MKKKILTGLTVFVLLTALLAAALVFLYDRRTHRCQNDAQRKADLAALNSQNYDALFLSMSAPGAFDTGAFDYFRATPALGAKHAPENLGDIGEYLKTAFLANPGLSSVYLVLDPWAVNRLYGNHASLYGKDYAKYLTDFCQDNPQTSFELLLPYYSLEYLRSLSDQALDEVVTSLRNMVNLCAPYENVTLYFLGDQEWLIANPGNYEAYNVCNTGVTSSILAFTFQDDRYALTTENMEERLARLTELTGAPAASYPDYSHCSIVFFGDSVIGNYQGSLSVPGAVQGLSGAKAYNIGLGGSSACGSTDPEAHTLNTLVDAFLKKDAEAFAQDAVPALGIRDFWAGHPEKLCFVLHFGLNDYFAGMRISSENPYDPYTYEGSIRLAVARLRETFPDCLIILSSPNFTSYYGNGTEKNSDVGGVLADYADALAALAQELQTDFLDNYRTLPVTAENHGLYLEDGCHPNVSLRYIYGQHFVQKLSEMLPTS